MKNLNDPEKDAAVLGGTLSPNTGAVVLGGIAGVKQRFASPLESSRAIALSEALKYGNEGSQIILDGLKDESLIVKRKAYNLALSLNSSPAIVDALQTNDLYSLVDCLHIVDDRAGMITALAISPNGKLIVSGSIDGCVSIWSVKTGRCLKRIRAAHANWVSSITISADSTIAYSGGRDGLIHVWHLPLRQRLKTLWKPFEEGISSILLACNDEIVVTDITGKIQIWTIEGSLKPTFKEIGRPIFSAVLIREKQAIAFTTNDTEGTVSILDLAGDRLMDFIPGTSFGLDSIASSIDGKYVATGGMDESIRIFDLPSKSCSQVLKGHRRCVNSVAFSGDGKALISSSNSSQLKIWDLASGENKVTHSDSKEGRVQAVAMSLANKFVFASAHGSVIKIWGIPTGEIN